MWVFVTGEANGECRSRSAATAVRLAVEYHTTANPKFALPVEGKL